MAVHSIAHMENPMGRRESGGLGHVGIEESDTA